jgi:hypothetical protein
VRLGGPDDADFSGVRYGKVREESAAPLQEFQVLGAQNGFANVAPAL